MKHVSDATVRERVRRGIAWLNDRAHGWRRKVVVKDLDLSNPCGCVLGQIEVEDAGGDYYRFCHENGLDEQQAVRLGFESGQTVRYPTLTRIWKEELRKIGMT